MDLFIRKAAVLSAFREILLKFNRKTLIKILTRNSE